MKDSRRTHWDKIIYEARAEVQATESQQQRRLDSLARPVEEEVSDGQALSGSNEYFGENLVNSHSSDGYILRSQSRIDTWASVFEWAEQQNKIRIASGFQDWKGPSLELLQSLRPCDLRQLLENEVLLRQFYGGQDCEDLVDEVSKCDLSAKKVRTLEYSVAKLVLKLLLYSSSDAQASMNGASVHDEPELPSPDDPPPGPFDDRDPLGSFGASKETQTAAIPTALPETQYRKDDRKLLRRLFQDKGEIYYRISELDGTLEELREISALSHPHFFEDFRSPSSPRYNGSFTMRCDPARTMNNSLYKILNEMSDERDVYTTVSKICFNLLKSETPPNTHSYNMLLMRFCHLKKTKFVHAIFRSMRESHIRPNEITHATLLRYYTDTGNGRGFTNYLLLMSGWNGGLVLAPTGLRIVDLVTERYHFFGLDCNPKAAMKARMNSEVYEALILGAIRFFGMQTAMEYYRDMISEGWAASVALLNGVLKKCLQSREWEAGFSVWNQIATTTEGASRTSYEWMLSLCQVCGHPAISDKILRDGVSQGVLPSSMMDMSPQIRHLSFEIYPKEIKSFAVGKRGRPECKSRKDDQAKKTTLDQSSKASAKVKQFRSFVNRVKSEKSRVKNEKSLILPIYNPDDSKPINWQILGQRLASLARDISKMSMDFATLRSNFRAHQLVNLQLIESVSTKVRGLNKDASQTMNTREYHEYLSRLQIRLRTTGQVTSRSLYEAFKSDRKSNPERWDGEALLDEENSESAIPSGSGLSHERLSMMRERIYYPQNDFDPSSDPPPLPESWNRLPKPELNGHDFMQPAW